MRRIMRRMLVKLCGFAMIVGFLNFLLFLAGALYLGGDAVNGKIENGKYYLWGYSYHEGTKGYTEVSQAIFDYSRWHVYSVMTTSPLMILAGLVYKRTPAED
jgi:hypothetical protein